MYKSLISLRFERKRKEKKKILKTGCKQLDLSEASGSDSCESSLLARQDYGECFSAIAIEFCVGVLTPFPIIIFIYRNFYYKNKIKFN